MNPPDFTEARKWSSEPCQLHIYQATITEFNGNGNINANTINDRSFITGLPKETIDQEKWNISNEIDIEESEVIFTLMWILELNNCHLFRLSINYKMMKIWKQVFHQIMR